MNNSEYTYRRATAKKRSDRRRRNRQMAVKSLRMVIICSILIFAVSIGALLSRLLMTRTEHEHISITQQYL